MECPAVHMTTGTGGVLGISDTVVRASKVFHTLENSFLSQMTFSTSKDDDDDDVH